MSDDEIYRSQGFGGDLRLGTRPALLVVDFVNGFLDPEVFGGGNIAGAAERSAAVLEAFRTRGLPIAFTRIVYADDGSDGGVWGEKVPSLLRLRETAPESQIAPGLAPRQGEIVIRKTNASAFFGTPLATVLLHAGADTLFVVGCTTSGCVRASVVDAISHGFRPAVIADCVGDRSRPAHEANLFDMGQKYANLVASADLAGCLDRMIETGREGPVWPVG